MKGIREVLEDFSAEKGKNSAGDAFTYHRLHRSSMFGDDPKNRGDSLFEKKQYEEALAIYRDILKSHPQDKDLLLKSYYTLFMMKFYNEAEDTFNRLSNLDHDNIDVYLEICDFLAHQAQEVHGQNFICWMLGSSGVGKSSTINRLAGREVRGVGNWVQTDPDIVPYEIHLHGLQVTVIDTPGVSDMLDDLNGKNHYFLTMRQFAQNQGVDSLMVCAPLTNVRFTRAERQGLAVITQEPGREIWKRSVTIFTFADHISSSENYSKLLEARTKDIRWVIARCIDDQHNVVGEEIANSVPIVAVSNLKAVTPDGKRWLSSLRLAMLNALARS